MATVTGGEHLLQRPAERQLDDLPVRLSAKRLGGPGRRRYVLCVAQPRRHRDLFHACPGGVPRWNARRQRRRRLGYCNATQPAQLNCAIPLGVCNPAGTSADPFAGMTVGQWFRSKHRRRSRREPAASTGSISPLAGGANELADMIKGSGGCNLPAARERQLVSRATSSHSTRPGTPASGFTKVPDTAGDGPPDFTGYAYNPANWDPVESERVRRYVADGDPNFLVSRGGAIQVYQGTPGSRGTRTRHRASMRAMARIAGSSRRRWSTARRGRRPTPNRFRYSVMPAC